MVRRDVLLRCRGCGASHRYPVHTASNWTDHDHDCSSGLPYFLQTTVRGRVLWASNLDHLQFLENYVRAQLRERFLGSTHKTTAARLPVWIKGANNRAELLRALATLRAKAHAAGL